MIPLSFFARLGYKLREIPAILRREFSLDTRLNRSRGRPLRDEEYEAAHAEIEGRMRRKGATPEEIDEAHESLDAGFREAGLL